MKDQIKEILLKQLQLLQEVDVDELSMVTAAKVSEAMAEAITIIGIDRANYVPTKVLELDTEALAKTIYKT